MDATLIEGGAVGVCSACAASLGADPAVAALLGAGLVWTLKGVCYLWRAWKLQREEKS